MEKDKCDDKTSDAFSSVLDEQQIKDTIKELGWNQKQIANYWGMTPKWISALIKNKNGERTSRDDCAFLGLPKK